MDEFIAICLGLGLSAACGFRIFVPLLVLSLAAKGGYVELADGFSWAGTWPAIVMLGTATILEIGASFIPWVDNFLDLAATPTAMMAGVITSAAVITDADPLIQWASAIIGGAGVAGIVQATSVTGRAGSTVSTAGLGNFTFSTMEWIASGALSVVAIVAPIIAGLFAVGCVVAAILFLSRRRRLRSLMPTDPAIHS